jgi:hypothetical protein
MIFQSIRRNAHSKDEQYDHKIQMRRLWSPDVQKMSSSAEQQLRSGRQLAYKRQSGPIKTHFPKPFGVEGLELDANKGGAEFCSD